MDRRNFLKCLTGLAGIAAYIGIPGATFAKLKLDGYGYVIVEPGGSIQAALDSLPEEGGTVFLREGTYQWVDLMKAVDSARQRSEDYRSIER
jgi:hypothetical protein